MAGKEQFEQAAIVPLPLAPPVWEQVFTVAPLVVIGTREADGAYDLAPKHLAMPLSWENHFGFICTATHATLQNARREGVFTVSYPRPNQALVASLAAGGREDDGHKPALERIATWKAPTIDGRFLADGYLFFACEVQHIYDDFGANSLVAGRIVAAYAAHDSLRGNDVNDRDLLQNAPLLAYLNWGRFARLSESFTFPFFRDFKR
jgi:flavin reductase (DIM6/NTAB) family NADH-FMN oxidoreductase RutF